MSNAELNEKNRGRVRSLFQGQPDAMKFIAFTLVAVMSAEATESILNELRGETTDLEKPVRELGNRPLRHFVNKTRKQLIDEFGSEESADKAIAALSAAGLQVSDIAKLPAPAEETENRAKRIRRSAAKKAATEPTFGNDQFPASELWDLTDEELKNVEGISGEDIAELRRLRDASGPITSPGVASVAGAPAGE